MTARCSHGYQLLLEGAKRVAVFPLADAGRLSPLPRALTTEAADEVFMAEALDRRWDLFPEAYDTAAWHGELRAGELLFVPCAGAHVLESVGASLAVRYAHHDAASVACARDAARTLARRGAPALPKGSWPWMLAEALENRTFGEDSDGGGGDGARGAARDAVLDARGDDGARAAPSVLELRHAMGCDDAMMADRERVWKERRRENAQRRRRRP